MNSSIFSLVPPIRRARGYRLYTADGRRLVDLWQDGGKALLGHTVPQLLNLLKDTASRGLFAPLPYPGALQKLERTVERLFPWGKLRLYNDMGGRRDIWKRAGSRDKIGSSTLPLPENVIDLAYAELPSPGTANHPWVSSGGPMPRMKRTLLSPCFHRNSRLWRNEVPWLFSRWRLYPGRSAPRFGDSRE